VTRWTPRCWGRRLTRRWNQAEPVRMPPVLRLEPGPPRPPPPLRPSSSQLIDAAAAPSPAAAAALSPAAAAAAAALLHLQQDQQSLSWPRDTGLRWRRRRRSWPASGSPAGRSRLQRRSGRGRGTTTNTSRHVRARLDTSRPVATRLTSHPHDPYVDQPPLANHRAVQFRFSGALRRHEGSAIGWKAPTRSMAACLLHRRRAAALGAPKRAGPVQRLHCGHAIDGATDIPLPLQPLTDVHLKQRLTPFSSVHWLLFLK